MRQQPLSIVIYGLTLTIGILAFLYPFLWPELVDDSANTGRAFDSPWVLTFLVGFCFLVLLLEVQGDVVSTKFTALLGVLVALNAVLRFVEVTIPGPGGFSPIFFLILITGYVYGGRFGFLLGALTLLVSALITGGVGPWLPFQMFTAGWAGLCAPLCRPLVRLMHAEGRWPEVLLLAFLGGAWGLLYGILINLWFWPFALGPAGQSWEAGITTLDLVKRYAAFYAVTSLGWDIARAAGNAVMLLAFAAPTLCTLRRFRKRFDFTYHSL